MICTDCTDDSHLRKGRVHVVTDKVDPLREQRVRVGDEADEKEDVELERDLFRRVVCVCLV